jgi:spore coat protein U-like protein
VVSHLPNDSQPSSVQTIVTVRIELIDGKEKQAIASALNFSGEKSNPASVGTTATITVTCTGLKTLW